MTPEGRDVFMNLLANSSRRFTLRAEALAAIVKSAQADWMSIALAIALFDSLLQQAS
jgi:hypothetical protein